MSYKYGYREVNMGSGKKYAVGFFDDDDRLTGAFRGKYKSEKRAKSEVAKLNLEHSKRY